MVKQIRRAILSVHLDIAEGCSRKSEAERKQFFEISKSSIIEIDAALGLYKTKEGLRQVGSQLLSTFQQLTRLIG